MDDDTDTTITSEETNITTTHETVRTWVESNGAKPALRTDETQGERELPYIYYPGTDGDDDESVEETSWEAFFERFDAHELALVRYGDRPNEGPGQLELVDRTGAYEEAERDTDPKSKVTETTEAPAETAAEAAVSATNEAPSLSPDDGDVGKRVVNASGEKVGVVTKVDEASSMVYVDPNPGIADRIKTRLGWKSRDEEAYSVSAERIEAIEDDEVRLKSL
ncbi:hypothetical protein [Halorussus halophilus]|uniref:hypothetical protein n=1 Tax=Halorussus halophilus TaxID=2650975 RepID=UPI001CE3F5E8|nr:hypothetical protein [Halorussus halophilus]